MRVVIFLCFALIFSGCNLGNSENQSKGFYENYAGWDIRYIPIIPPFKAVSAYPEVWFIDVQNNKVRQNDHTMGDISVQSFGVSGCFIFGTQPVGYSEEIKNWFLFNTSTLEFMVLDSEEMLLAELKTRQANMTDIATCDSYFDALMDEQRCYWFPEVGASEYENCISNKIE